MRLQFFALLLFLGQVLHAQQDSIPSQKITDTTKTVVADTIGSVAKDTIALDSIAISRDSILHMKKKQKAKDSVFLQKKSVDSIRVRQKDTIALDSVKKTQGGFGSFRKKQPKKEEERDSVTIKDYKIISHRGDTTYLDTTLTIRKEYKYNYIRQDDFELMPFANIGQPYNVLGRSFSQNPYYPRMGASAKHANYFEVEDIQYYSVPKPMTELFFKTTLEQGQLLDALLTFNLSKRFNASIAYKGFRSLGKYRFEQAQSGNFRSTFNYSSQNDRYHLRGHITAQDLEAEENGGLLNRDQFENDVDGEFEDRFRIDVRYTDANTRVLGKRYYLDHQFKFLKGKKDSLNSNPTTLSAGHEFMYETKIYDFTQTSQNDAFGQEPFLVPIEDRARLKTMLNKGTLRFSNKLLGQISGGVGLYNYNYFFNSILITEEGTIPNKLEGEEIVVNGTYSKNIGPLSLYGDLNYTISGDLTGNSLNARATYQVNDNNLVMGAVNLSSRMPDFNYLLYQSEYRNFNWFNADIFEKQRTQNISFGFDSRKWGLLEAEYSAIDNYTYFTSTATQDQIDAGQETAFVRPFQQTNTINHLRVKYTKELKWRKWALANTLLYQEVTQDENVLNLPQLVTRNTLYFSSDVFKKAMFLQTGVTFKYFTAYNMNAFNPLLGEFYIQNNEEFGAYPLIDVFINAKVRQTRIYLKAEHLNSIFSEPIYYSAPNYPYRDFVIRFGLVWNFFS